MTDASSTDDPWFVVEMIAGGIALLTAIAAIPYVATFLHSGQLADQSLSESVVGVGRVVIDGRWDDPASAFPWAVRQGMPAAEGWWGAAAWTFAMLASVSVGIWRRVDAFVSASSAARRPYELRGSRTRTWARLRDLAGAVDRCRRPDRFTLGRLDGRLMLSDAESHVALIAPTRSGKTTRYVIPWLLEHDGPAIVTSTKLDVVKAASDARRARGDVWVWDPFGEGTVTWNPLRGCANWSHALAQAQWLADSAGEGDSEIAAYWRGEAAKLLAPLLHAAALAKRPMSQVLAWVDAQDVDEPGTILSDAKKGAAGTQLKSVNALDSRNRGTTYMSAGSLLAAYRYPELEPKDHVELVVKEFLDSGPATLFVVAAARHQRLLAPLVVALLSSVFHEAAEQTRRGVVPRATLRVLLDEAANIAPIRDLPAHLSQAAGNGVRIATVWQSLAQLHDRYRAGADSVLANSTSKVFMGPITDERTRRYVQGLLGEVAVETRSRTEAGVLDGGRSSRTRSSTMRSAVGSPELQQLRGDRALVVEGARKPALVATRAWWSEARWR